MSQRARSKGQFFKEARSVESPLAEAYLLYLLARFGNVYQFLVDPTYLSESLAIYFLYHC